MGLFGNNERKREFTFKNGGNVANGGRTLPDVEINSPRIFEEFGINLEPKNGEDHSILLDFAMHDVEGVCGFVVYREYAKVEKLTSLMQKDGYELLDIRVVNRSENGIELLIMYK